MDKLYSIGELSQILGVKPSVIRFWETQFDIQPVRTKGGQRRYTSEHLELFRKIKILLYLERYTIEGAKRKLSNYVPPSEMEILDFLLTIRKHLRDILKYISETGQGYFEDNKNNENS